MKLIEPRKPIILRSTGFLSGKTTVGDRFGKVSGDSGGVVEAQHALKRYVGNSGDPVGSQISFGCLSMARE